MNISINIRANINMISFHISFLLSFNDNQENKSISESNDDDIFIIIDIKLINFSEKSRYKKFFEEKSFSHSNIFFTNLFITIESKINFSNIIKHFTSQVSYENHYSR